MSTPTLVEPAQASGGTDAAAAPQQFLRFALERELCAVRIDVVREILEVVQMTPLPLMPAFVRGVMNLRGAVVPVIDLSARLGLASTTIGRRTCVVIVDIVDSEQDSHQTLGVLVDAVHEVFDIGGAEVEPVPRLGTSISPRFIRSMVRVRGQATPELNLHTILDHQELAGLIGSHSALH
jgi:purine-binding chemotaxis protein CheW